LKWEVRKSVQRGDIVDEIDSKGRKEKIGKKVFFYFVDRRNRKIEKSSKEKKKSKKIEVISSTICDFVCRYHSIF
jgi:hypothetical protein